MACIRRYGYRRGCRKTPELILKEYIQPEWAAGFQARKLALAWLRPELINDAFSS
jgi:protoheme ferro-lyase